MPRNHQIVRILTVAKALSQTRRGISLKSLAAVTDGIGARCTTTKTHWKRRVPSPERQGSPPHDGRMERAPTAWHRARRGPGALCHARVGRELARHGPRAPPRTPLDEADCDGAWPRRAPACDPRALVLRSLADRHRLSRPRQDHRDLRSGSPRSTGRQRALPGPCPPEQSPRA